MFGRANFVDIYLHLQGMRDRSMRSGMELAREIKLTDWSMAGNLSNRSSGVQIPRDICTRLKRYLYSGKCSWIINPDIFQSATSRSFYWIGLPSRRIRQILQRIRIFLNPLSRVEKINPETPR